MIHCDGVRRDMGLVVVKCRILRRRVYVFEIVRAGGTMMLPIILCSIVAIAIVIERFWTLSPSRIAPRNALADVWAGIPGHPMAAAGAYAEMTPAFA